MQVGRVWPIIDSVGGKVTLRLRATAGHGRLINRIRYENMARSDDTNIGGDIDEFQTTLWTVIHKVASSDDDHQKRILTGDLLDRYWKPVYCYLRHKGYNNEQAKDLTQGFFHEVVLGRKLIQLADKQKGRFRTFMLTALDRYLTSEHRKRTAQKRIPTDKIFSLDRMDPAEMSEPVSDFTPAESFNYAWVSTLLDKVVAEVKAECCNDSMTVHWKAFYDRVLRPMKEDHDPAQLRQICQDHGIEDSTRASNMVITVKRRFQAALKRRLRQSVGSDAEVDEELKELMQVFSKKSAG